jgi:peptide-methionine (S)-S-oxide reductase
MRTTILTLCFIAVAVATVVFAKGPGKEATGQPPAGLARATFAGGCFWCMEPPFEKLDGVISATSGYTGGPELRPTYEQVSAGSTGHTEAVEIIFDPKKISYEELLEVFWHNIDPTVENKQFCDWGPQYRTAIFTHDDGQRRLAEASKVTIEKTKSFADEIVTPIETADAFYPAEDYHQDYSKKNPERYYRYRNGCGRDARLAELWGRK